MTAQRSGGAAHGLQIQRPGEDVHIPPLENAGSVAVPDPVKIGLLHAVEPSVKARRSKFQRGGADVLRHLFALGLEDGYVQELSSAKKEYIPDFSTDALSQFLSSI